MGTVDCWWREENGGKRKSEFQLQSLESFYSEEKYPGRKAMDEYGIYLGLTYNQVRIWFSERRRKEKRNGVHRGNKGTQAKSTSEKEMEIESESLEFSEADGIHSELDCNNRSMGKGGKVGYRTSQNCKRVREAPEYTKLQPGSSKGQLRSSSGSRNTLGRRPHARVQVLPSQDYILTSVFRKDGPPLGIEFDPVPARGFDPQTCCSVRHPFSKKSKRISNKRKILVYANNDPCNLVGTNISTGRHGIGKGLMTVWRATHPDGTFPVGVSSSDRRIAQNLNSNEPNKNKPRRSNTQHRQNQAMKAFQNKIGERRKQQLKRAKALCTKNRNSAKQPHPFVECGLLCGGLRSQGQSSSSSRLMDDEELELSELQAHSTSIICSAHLTSNGEHGCPLCKDMLGRFPPQLVNMKQPIGFRPWVSSPDAVKKLFKVFQFLYTYADRVNVGSFTLDELAEAFQEKDLFLLGKIHVTILKVLLSNVHAGICSGFQPASKDCRFLGFMHSVKHQDFDVALWIQSLNSLTWTEIMRQVSIVAGFGSFGYSTRRETSKNEGNDMAKYGLHPHTLKHELFCILSEQGSRGLKVSELAKAAQIVALGLPSSSDKLECLISSTLSSDITLFEKIGTSAFRLRTGLSHKLEETSDSESNDSGSIDNDRVSCSSGSGSDEYACDLLELDSASNVKSTVPYKGCPKRKSRRPRKCIEIDESFSGEAWLLGLMEGKYSDLSIEEKLDALISLVDLTNSALSLGIDEATVASSNISNATSGRSGGKIRKSNCQPVCDDLASRKLRGFRGGFGPVEHDAAAKKCRAEETEPHQHLLQAINLGSDRRYNRYWLFLGPCDRSDPGHRRVYFESSEDGHWEVIDTKQALSSLMSVLDCRGIREAHLFASLESREGFLSKAMTEYMETVMGVDLRRLTDSPDSDAFSGNGSSLISDVDNNLVFGGHTDACIVSPGVLAAETERKCVEKKLRRDQSEAFDKWIWTSFFESLNAVKNWKGSYYESLVHCGRCHDLFWRDEKHCKICHTTFELDFDLEEKYAIHIATCSEPNDTSLSPSHKVLPSKLQALKAAIYAIAAVMPEEALVGWTKSTHNLWGKRLRRTSSLPELFLVVKDFVGVIKEDWLHNCALHLGLGPLDDIIKPFQTMPQTVAAIALWMAKLDILIASHTERIKSTDVVVSTSMPESKRMRTRSC